MTDPPGRERVLVAADHYVPGFKAGGAIRSLANLIELFGKEISFTVVTRDRDLGEAAPYLASDLAGVRGTANVVYCPPGRRAIALLSTARRNPFDVLYLNSLFSKAFGILPLMARRARLLPKSRLLIAPHGELHPGALHFNRGRKVAYLRLAALLQLFNGAEWHASTDEEAAQIRHWIGAAAPIHVAPSVFVIPRGEELGTWPEKTSGALRLAFLARVHPKKNLDFALGVLATLSGNITLDIYGPIEDEHYWIKCRDLMSSLPAGIRVTYQGALGWSKVLGVLAQHDVLFLPTRGENFGHVIAEALAAGCPPLISDQTPWDVGLRGAGWSIPLDEPERYAETVTRLLEMEDGEFRGYRKRAREYAEEISISSGARRANRELFMSPPHTRRRERNRWTHLF